MFSFSSPSGLSHKISSRPSVLETAQCCLRRSFATFTFLGSKRQFPFGFVHLLRSLQPPRAFSPSHPTSSSKQPFPSCSSSVVHRHRHRPLSPNSRVLPKREAKLLLNHSLPLNAGRPLGTRCVCLCRGRTEKRRALGLGLHRMNNFPLKVTHFLFSVFRQSGPIGRL